MGRAILSAITLTTIILGSTQAAPAPDSAADSQRVTTTPGEGEDLVISAPSGREDAIGSASSELEEPPGAAPEEPADMGLATQGNTSPSSDPFRAAIKLLESSHGAYAPALSEQLLSLGRALQQEGRHEEAVDVFKRGAHLSRINDGLYGMQQLPLLGAQIQSHLALREYSEADDRQQYLYRVQVRGMSSGQSRAQALMEQANWQFNAYRLKIGELTYPRLVHMWDLYRLALNDLITSNGKTSPELLQPLTGMLQAQYLIAGYRVSPEAGGSGAGDSLDNRDERNRFQAYRSESFDKGRAVIQAIYDIEREQPDDSSQATARTLVMLGDWYQWHGQREDAHGAYLDAQAELLALDDAQVEIGRLFSEPRALPDVDGVRPLRQVAKDATSADHVLLEYSVTVRGRAVEIERLDDNPGLDGRANRLMRRLRNVPFRPRYEAGQPVLAEKLVRAYEVN